MTQKFSRAGLEVKTWLELNDFYAKTVKMYDVQFGVLRIIILLMVLLSVVNSVNMSVFERVGEFGTMMALGNRSRTGVRPDHRGERHDWPGRRHAWCRPGHRAGAGSFRPSAFPCRRRPTPT